MRATHISVVHPTFDTRIFRKQCRALAAAGHEVHLLVGGGVNRTVDGVRVHSLATSGQRATLREQLPRQLRAARLAWSLRPTVYHLHDPHLIPLGLALKLTGATVVYDVHEDYVAHARTKLHDRSFRRELTALTWRSLESLARRYLDHFVGASPQIVEAFPPERTVLVGNFPLLRDFESSDVMPYHERPNLLVQTGYVLPVRGCWEVLEALERLPESLHCRLRMVGRCRSLRLERRLRRHPAWSRVELLGWQPFDQVVKEQFGARIGLAPFWALPNHRDADRSNKLFEYMAAGLPVIACDTPRWREFVCGLDCGLVVKPGDPQALAAAIEYLLTHPAEAEAMGRRGRAAVLSQFNWGAERERLLALYEQLDGRPAATRTEQFESALST